ncbi:ABC transporter ATP-binding protein [Streptomyces sp. NPDC047009]|uniref:ABC transporter ATP-binding protein n=1 Tax=Streptomyces sp. NPDC047009 TaxID=3154496 RepID=UPI0033C72E90
MSRTGNPAATLDGTISDAGTSADALRTEDLTWGVDGFTIVASVSLRVRRGEFLTVIGPNGAGKSTLVNLLCGVHRPTSGSVFLDGVDVTRMRSARRVRRGLGRTFQTSSLFTGLTAHQNAWLAARASLGGSANLWRRPRADDEASVRVRRCLADVGLADRAHVRVADLPYGDKRKLEIAVALCGEPTVLLLDEPTAGVSAEEVHALVDVVRAVHAAGHTVVMVEHRMDLVLGVSDRIAVMQDGGLLMCDVPDAVMADARVQAAYLGPEL